MELVGRRYDNGQPVRIEVHEGTIAALGQWNRRALGSLPWIAPGLVDLQVNGYGGHEFTDCELQDQAVVDICRAMDRQAVTRFLPTVVTQSNALLTHALGRIGLAIDDHPDVRRRAAGIHLEGPYISAHDGPRGAHPRDHCRPPAWDEFCQLQEAARGHIRLLTMSPEYDGSAEFIRRVAESGVVVSIGHTCATTGQLLEAVDAGARLSTHLGNGAHATLRRHPNYIWDQLADDRLVATLIADGHHLPPNVVKCFVRAKSANRIVLVSDLTGLAGALGTDPGRYSTPALGEVELLDDGRVVVAGQRDYLAGATLPLCDGVARVMQYAGIDLATAIDLASSRPAELLGLERSWLQIGGRADLIQFQLEDDPTRMDVLCTINAGQVVHGQAVMAAG